MTLALLRPPYAPGDTAWHCATHGGPDRRGDLMRHRWRRAMEPCTILDASEPDRFGHITYTIATARCASRTVSDSWLSLSPDLPPPYFDR